MDKALKIPASIALPIAAVYLAAYQLSYDTVTIAVEDKNAIFDQNSSPGDGYVPHNWMIYTADEVFKVTASWTHGEFNAAEKYHALKVGSIYTVRVGGWRIPAIIWYREIVRIEGAASDA